MTRIPGYGLLARILNRTANADGQALVILAGGMVIFLGMVAMSIDVGRYVWARTQMQAAVDASALAAAQSMPDQVDAELKASEYWVDNAQFIINQGNNVQFQVTFPSQSNKGVVIRGDADVPTWFAKFFGVNSWHVWAEGEAESQVLDISVVLDISGSMCFDSYPNMTSNQGSAIYMSPGDNPPRVTANIPASSPGTTMNITVSSTTIFNMTSSSSNSSEFGYSSTTPYYQRNIGGQTGFIKVDNELMRIMSIVNGTTLQVRRGQVNGATGSATAAVSHAAHTTSNPRYVWANRLSCSRAAWTSNGPYEPYDGMIDAAEYFTTLFNPNYDKLSLGSYSSSGDIRETLTGSFGAVTSEMNSMGAPNGGTNIPHGLAIGRQLLDGAGKRANAVRVLVLLTDGVSNTYCGSSTYGSGSAYNTTGCSGPNSSVATSVNHALSEAQRAANGDIIIFTIGLGFGVDSGFLQQVADIGGGSYYFAPTTAQLDAAFQSIAEQTHIALVR